MEPYTILNVCKVFKPNENLHMSVDGIEDIPASSKYFSTQVRANKTRIVKLHNVEKALYRTNYSIELKHRIFKAIREQQVYFRGV